MTEAPRAGDASPSSTALRHRIVELLRELERNDVVATLVAIWRYGRKNQPLSATESRDEEPGRYEGAAD